MPKHDFVRASQLPRWHWRHPTRVMLQPWPICPRQTGGPPLFVALRASRCGPRFPTLAAEQRTPQELPTMCSMIAVVETDGVRGR